LDIYDAALEKVPNGLIVIDTSSKEKKVLLSNEEGRMI
jgi:hypothetical protein